MSKYVYRLVNPRNDEDVKKFIELKISLAKFLNAKLDLSDKMIKWTKIHLGAVEGLGLDKFKDKPLPNFEDSADEFVYVCEVDGKFVGCIHICTYHVVNKKRPDDDIGIISDMYVQEKYQGYDKDEKISIAWELLNLGVDKLLEKGKFKAICNVQEDNENRFLHFAMADSNVVAVGTAKRKDGTETKDYTLLIDLKKLKNMTGEQLIRKASKLKREYLRNQQGVTV